MLKKELELLVETQKQKITELQDEIEEKEDIIHDCDLELKELKSVERAVTLGRMTMVEQKIFDNNISMIKGFRNGRGNMLEFEKFQNLCFERYNIIP